VTHQTLFNSRYDLYMLEVATSRVVHLPGEPACGEALVCDAHISGDGAYLVRTLPSSTSDRPVVVINLTTGGIVAQFEPVAIPAGAAFEIGYPFLTPGGELIYEQAYGPLGLEQYQLVWANLVTGEQRILADLGSRASPAFGMGCGWNYTLDHPRARSFRYLADKYRDGSHPTDCRDAIPGHVQEPSNTVEA
jgi:hypothetical protein